MLQINTGTEKKNRWFTQFVCVFHAPNPCQICGPHVVTYEDDWKCDTAGSFQASVHIHQTTLCHSAPIPLQLENRMGKRGPPTRHAVRNSTFSHQCRRGLRTCGMWCCITVWMAADIPPKRRQPLTTLQHSAISQDIWIHTKCRKIGGSGYNIRLRWDLCSSGILRGVDWRLSTFRGNLWVPSSRINQSKKKYYFTWQWNLRWAGTAQSV